MTRFLPVLFLLSLTGMANAQGVPAKPAPPPNPVPTATPPAGPPPCPKVTVQGQPNQARHGERIFFSANIAGGDPKVTPTIVWSTSGGSIIQGHNSRRIEVDTTGSPPTADREIRGEVWVGGYQPECLLQASSTVKMIPPPAKFGEFGVVDDETFKRNMDALSKFLAQSPDNLHVIVYAGRNSERGFTQNWFKRIREALVAAEILPRRVSGVDGGYREEPLLEFWIVPVGVDPPRPQPTIKRSDIVTPTTRPGRRPQ